MVANVSSNDSAARARDIIEAPKAKAAAEADSSSVDESSESPVQEGNAPEAVSADKMLGDMDTVGRANFSASGNAGGPEEDVVGVDGLEGDGLEVTQAEIDAAVAEAEANSYTVQSGDSLSQIILDAGLPEGVSLSDAVAQVASANGIDNPNLIHPGQVFDLSSLQAPTDEAGVESAAAAADQTYTVESGDSLSQIVLDAGLPEGVSLADAVASVAEANGIDNPNLIRVGQEFDLSALNPAAAEEGVDEVGVDEPTTAEDFEDVGVGILQVQAGAHDDVIIDEIAELDGIEEQDIDVIGVDGTTRPTEDFEDVVQADSIDFVNNISDSIEGILNDPESDLRVLNVSIAGNGSRSVTGLLESAGLYDPATGEVTDAASAQILVDEALNILANDPEVAAAMERYNQITAQAAEQGLTIVVAADNEGRDIQALLDAGVNVPDGFGFNLLGQSSNVISVGNVETNDTPDVADDGLVSTSSGGGLSFDGTQQFNPTFAADGNGIIGEDGQNWSGTSFAAPQVVKAVLDLLAENASLTFNEILNALKGLAVDNPAIPENFDGFGVLFAPNDIA